MQLEESNTSRIHLCTYHRISFYSFDHIQYVHNFCPQMVALHIINLIPFFLPLFSVKHREGLNTLSNDDVWGMLRDREHGWMFLGGIQEARLDPLPILDAT